MKLRIRVITTALCCLLLAPVAWAGYMEGLAAVLKEDYGTALRELRPLAEKGNRGAQFLLGRMHEDGSGVPQDFKEAARWYRLAADQGDATAQLFLGLMHERGQGVPQDFKEANRWYRLAADQGNATAQYNLGGSYVSGHGVPQDFKEAIRWFRLAADQGDAGALANLGVMHSKGYGVPQNRVIAYALSNLSASIDTSSANTATSNRNKLIEQMTPSEIEAGQALTREMVQAKNLLVALDRYARMAASNARTPTPAP